MLNIWNVSFEMCKNKNFVNIEIKKTSLFFFIITFLNVFLFKNYNLMDICMYLYVWKACIRQKNVD